MLLSTIARAGGDLTNPSANHAGSGYRFLFPGLAPWEPPGRDNPSKRDALFELSERLYEDSPGEGGLPAGYTYLAQFVAHDITFDAGVPGVVGPHLAPNMRTPRFDLDSVYDRGPTGSPHLYTRRDEGRLLVGSSVGNELDLPRNRDESTRQLSRLKKNRRHTALIGDPRNDENIIVSQIHLAFLRFHNERLTRTEDFEEARRLTRWHYQWVVLRDLLPSLLLPDVYQSLFDERGRPRLRFFDLTAPAFIPLEFALGAFRFGHAMIRSTYRLSDALDRDLSIFGREDAPTRTLVGGRSLPERWSVQWDRFVEHEGSAPQRARPVGPSIAPALRRLPLEVNEERFRSLSYRTLDRSWRLGLPSGQAVAKAMGLKPHDGDDPLWLYVLEEARREGQGGRTLGTLGGTLVGEVLVGLMAQDPTSFLRLDPGWKPELPYQGPDFGLSDLLAHSGAPMTAADWNGRPRPKYE